MKWFLFITSVACCSLLAKSDGSGEPQSTRPTSFLTPTAEDRLFDFKSHKKRGIPTFSHGYDIPIIRHSILKPFIVQYPVQSIPIGVKIPLKNPNSQKFASSGHKFHGSGTKFHHFNIHSPVHLPPTVKPAWPSNNCNHGQATQPVHRPVAPPPLPPAPIAPTASVNVPINIIPAPALTPVLPLPRPPLPFVVKPLLHPPVFGPVPFAPVPLTPVPVAPAPLLPTFTPVAPIQQAILPAAPVPSIIRPGHSLHTSYFATFPRHHYVNALPAITPHIPVVGAPAAPLGVGRIPIGLGHVPFNVGRFPVNIGQVPLNVAHPQVIANQIPVGNIPVNFPVGQPFGSAQIPVQTPLGVAQNPVFDQRPGFQYPIQTPLGIPQTPVFEQKPGFQYPFQTPLDVSQNPVFEQKPGFQYPFQTLTPEGPTNPQIIPGVQDLGNNVNTIQNVNPTDSNVWTPMASPSPTPESVFPTFQYPPQFNPQEDTTQFQPQGTSPPNDQQNPDQNQGYVYQQNGNQAFQDGKDVQENLQQAQQQFLNAQQFFGQQQQQLQEQQQHQESLNQQDPRNTEQQQYLQEQQQFLNQQQFEQTQQEPAQLQQQDFQEDDVQQFSSQHFITGDQLAAANPQHDPQLPQALPDHPLAGRPINQAFRINHRRRQKHRARKTENQEN